MAQRKLLRLDLTKASSPQQILPCKPSLNSHLTNDRGIILRQYSQLPPYELTEYYPQQHLVIIHQQPHQVRVKRKINGKKRDLTMMESDITLIPANNSHGASWHDELELIILIIDPNFVSQIAHEWIDPDRIELLPHFARCDRFIYQVGVLLKNSLLTTESSFYTESMITALSSHLIQHYSTKKPLFQDYAGGLSKSKLKRVQEYIGDRLTENISLQEMSSEIGLSRCYFAQMFKKSTGITPYQYVLQQRIEKSKQLLKQDVLPLVEIALICGFSSQSAFSRTFRKCVGTTPKTYRQQI